MRCAGCGVGRGHGAPVHRKKHNFHQKNKLSSEKTHMVWKTFFCVFAERSPTPYFYDELSTSRGPSFHDFDSQLAKLHFWPKRGQWDTIGSQFEPIWIKFDPQLGAIGTHLGPIYIHKLPINRPSGRYVNNNQGCGVLAFRRDLLLPTGPTHPHPSYTKI